MKYLTLSLIAISLRVFAQAPTAPKPAAVTPDTVVFKVAGKPVTAAEFDRLLASFPPDIQQAARTDPRQVMQSYYLMQHLGQRALAEKIDQTSPYKEQMELQRMQFLASTLLNRESGRIAVTDEETKARYEADKAGKYEQAKVRAIVVMFADPRTAVADVNMGDLNKPKVTAVTGVRQESEAKSIAQDVVKQLRGGASFEELARQKSDDKGSAAKGGDFGVIRRTDRIPDEIKKAVFALRPGEISEPVRLRSALYVLKLEERTIQPLTEVQRIVADEIKQERFQNMMSGLQKQFEVTIENTEFFAAKPPAGAAAKPR